MKQPHRPLLWETLESKERARPPEPLRDAPAVSSVDPLFIIIMDLMPGRAAAAGWPLMPVVIVSLRTFLWVWKAMMCSLGPNRQTSATVALRVTDRQRVVSWTWLTTQCHETSHKFYSQMSTHDIQIILILIPILARPSVSSSLQIASRSFRDAYLWNQLPFFIPTASFCSLSSWFTSFCAYHLITVTIFALTICHSLDPSLQT